MADSALENLTDAAGEKIGPLPAWGWGLIVAGVALVAYFLWGRSAASAPVKAATTASSDPGYTGDGIPDDTTSIDGGTGSSGSTGDSTSSGDTGTSDPSGFSFSNTAWLARGVTQVSLEFGASPTDVYAALYAGLTGGTMTTSQKRYWDRALSDLGVPPEGTEGVVQVVPDPVASNPTSNTTPAPTNSTPATPPKATTPTPSPAKTTTTTSTSKSITAVALGSTYKLEKAHSGYKTAEDANKGNTAKRVKMLDPGTYVVVGRQKLSSGYVVRLLRGTTALWINV